MDGSLIARAVVFAGALAVAFAVVLGGVFAIVSANIGEGFMRRQGRFLKVLIPAAAITAGVALAIAGTVWFMHGLPR